MSGAMARRCKSEYIEAAIMLVIVVFSSPPNCTISVACSSYFGRTILSALNENDPCPTNSDMFWNVDTFASDDLERSFSGFDVQISPLCNSVRCAINWGCHVSATAPQALAPRPFFFPQTCSKAERCSFPANATLVQSLTLICVHGGR